MRRLKGILDHSAVLTRALKSRLQKDVVVDRQGAWSPSMRPGIEVVNHQ